MKLPGDRSFTRHVPNCVTLVGAMLTASAAAACLTAHVPPSVTLLFLFMGQICDVLDGYLARRYGFVSSFGAELDLTCDRVLAHLLAYTVLGPMWLLLVPLAIVVQVLSGSSMSGRAAAAGLLACSVLHSHYL